MTPQYVIIWSCVVIFIVTAILTLLHISGIRPLPNADHGNVLFKALIVEIVVISVGFFSSTLLPENKYPGMGTLGGMAMSQGTFLYPDESDEGEPLLPKSTEAIAYFSQGPTNPLPLDESCYQITNIDASTFPPTSRIETICNN